MALGDNRRVRPASVITIATAFALAVGGLAWALSASTADEPELGPGIVVPAPRDARQTSERRDGDRSRGPRRGGDGTRRDRTASRQRDDGSQAGAAGGPAPPVSQPALPPTSGDDDDDFDDDDFDDGGGDDDDGGGDD